MVGESPGCRKGTVEVTFRGTIACPPRQVDRAIAGRSLQAAGSARRARWRHEKRDVSGLEGDEAGALDDLHRGVDAGRHELVRRRGAERSIVAAWMNLVGLLRWCCARNVVAILSAAAPAPSSAKRKRRWSLHVCGRPGGASAFAVTDAMSRVAPPVSRVADMPRETKGKPETVAMGDAERRRSARPAPLWARRRRPF